MEELLLNVIQETLDSLEKLTVWIFSALIIVLIAMSSRNKVLSFGAFSIPKKSAGAIMYLVLTALSFSVLKLLTNLNGAYLKLQKARAINCENIFIEKANMIIHTHVWVFNPFSEAGYIESSFIDNVGYPLLIIIWCVGGSLAQVILITLRGFSQSFAIACGGAYTIVGINCANEIRKLTGLVCSNISSKQTAANYGLVVGVVLGVIVVLIISNSNYEPGPDSEVKPRRPDGLWSG